MIIDKESNRLEKLVMQKIAEIEDKYHKMFCDTVLDDEHRELYVFREQETNTILAENVWNWFAEILLDALVNPANGGLTEKTLMDKTLAKYLDDEKDKLEYWDLIEKRCAIGGQLASLTIRLEKLHNKMKMDSRLSG